MPWAVALVAAVTTLLTAQTPPLDVLRYLGYAAWCVVLPGTLVWRAVRRVPFTLVEDLAMGAATGLVLELAVWALLSATDLRFLAPVWPVLVVGPFLVLRPLRRHWRPHGYRPVPPAWSWGLAGVLLFLDGYLYLAFFAVNPILPDTEETRQFVDLAYQLSLAGEAKHSFPPGLPQVAGEPLHYHWFAFAHLAMTSLAGGIDLPVVTMRLMVPVMCSLVAVLIAVTGWRLSGRAETGVVAAVLLFVVGTVNFTDPISKPFGNQLELVLWPSLSFSYSFVLLLALVLLAGDLLRAPELTPSVPEIGDRCLVLVLLLAVAVGGAKASTLPAFLGGVGLCGLIHLLRTRSVPGRVLTVGMIGVVAQAITSFLLFDLQPYGLQVSPVAALRTFWAPPSEGRPAPVQVLVVVAVVLAFLGNMYLRLAGAVSLFWLRRGHPDPVRWFLLGGALTGPAVHLSLAGFNARWFSRSALPLGVLLSAWGYVLVLERARLTRRGRVVLVTGTVATAVLLCWLTTALAPAASTQGAFSPLQPMLGCIGVLALVPLGGVLVWPKLTRRRPGIRGTGGLLALTWLLVAGAPGMVMDARLSASRVNGGGYELTVPVPTRRVEAARWVRDHSRPDDVLATNVHCYEWSDRPGTVCREALSFWLSAYAERTVLVESWKYAPRQVAEGPENLPFWDPGKLALNDAAFSRPTRRIIEELSRRYQVRFLVVDRRVAHESSELAQLTRLRFDNGRLAVYEVAPI
jgi:hypothetical protein